jgi:hypothetical protein
VLLVRKVVGLLFVFDHRLMIRLLKNSFFFYLLFNCLELIF